MYCVVNLVSLGYEAVTFTCAAVAVIYRTRICLSSNESSQISGDYKLIMLRSHHFCVTVLTAFRKKVFRYKYELLYQGEGWEVGAEHVYLVRIENAKPGAQLLRCVDFE
jgi:hypothetical protein